MHPILRLAPVDAYSVTHLTILLEAAGKLVVKPFYRTNASDSEGMSMMIFSSRFVEVDWEILNFKVKELYGM